MEGRVLLVLGITNFLSAMGITIVVPLIGDIPSIFGVSPAYGIWVITAFMLSYSVGMAVVGRLSDAVGRRPVYAGAMGTFALGLLVSAVAPGFGGVLAGRFIQGLGASGALPLAQAIAYERFGDRRGRALGAISAAFGIGVVAAINLGGAIYSVLGWRAVFAITGGMGLLGFALVFLLPETLTAREQGRIDLPGIASLGLAIAAFMLLFKELGEGSSFLSGPVVPYAVALVLAVLAFAIVERRTPSPAIDLSLFRNRRFSLTIAASLLGGTGMFIFQTFLPGYAQILLGYTVSQAAYSVDVMAAFMIVAAAVTGSLCDRLGPARVLLFSLAMTEIAFALIVYVPMPTVAYYLGSAVAGVGLGSLIPPTVMIAIREGGRGKEGVTSAIASLARTMGGIVGPTVAGFILSRTDFSSLFALANLLASYRRIYLFGMWAVALGLGTAVPLWIAEKSGERS